MANAVSRLRFRLSEGQVGQESNLQPAVLETAALPIELPTYRLRITLLCLGSIPHCRQTVKPPGRAIAANPRPSATIHGDQQ